MIAAAEIFKRLFIWGVTAVALVPRQHIDDSSFNLSSIIGGRLSYSFKKLLLALVAVNFVRLVLKDSSIKDQFQLLRDLLGILQQVGISFLCFLTPYILQTWLAPLIHIGGRPGQNLMPTLYASTALSVMAAILSRLVHPNFWALRKLGNAMSSIPVLNTLRQFDAVTTRGGIHQGRGTIMSQSVRMVEYWYLVIQLLGVIGFLMNNGAKVVVMVQNKASHLMAMNESGIQQPPEPEYQEGGQWDQIWSAFRDASFVLDWTRILTHALFINQLDELYLSSSSSSSPTSNGDGNDEETAPSLAKQPEKKEGGALVVRRMHG